MLTDPDPLTRHQEPFHQSGNPVLLFARCPSEVPHLWDPWAGQLLSWWPDGNCGLDLRQPWLWRGETERGGDDGMMARMGYPRPGSQVLGFGGATCFQQETLKTSDDGGKGDHHRGPEMAPRPLAPATPLPPTPELEPWFLPTEPLLGTLTPLVGVSRGHRCCLSLLAPPSPRTINICLLVLRRKVGGVSKGATHTVVLGELRGRPRSLPHRCPVTLLLTLHSSLEAGPLLGRSHSTPSSILRPGSHPKSEEAGGGRG